jgi:hypothetical protein
MSEKTGRAAGIGSRARRAPHLATPFKNRRDRAGSHGYDMTPPNITSFRENIR